MSSGVLVARDIRRYQRSTKMLVPKLDFQRAVAGIVMKV
jgi:histone H3/H4